MYLSRIILNPTSRRVQRELSEPYEMHRSLEHCFDYLPSEERRRMLFRVDIHPRTGVPTVLLQSPHEPRWDWLHDRGAVNYVMLTRNQNPDTKTMAYQLFSGQILAFRLRANPTVKHTFEDGTKKRIGLIREDEQRAWLERKAEQDGFRVSHVMVNQEGTVHGWLHRGEKRHRLSFLSVRFDGLLHVDNPQLVWKAVQQGIGSAKGFGFGLLSLAPAQT